jgi:hypothetical protein
MAIGVRESFEDQRYSQFLFKIAHALESWRLIENWVLLLFMELLRSPKREYSIIAFESVLGFRDRLAMVDSLILYRVLSKSLRRDWEAIKENIISLSTDRNHLVHWQRHQVVDSKDSALIEQILVQSIIDPRRRRKKPGRSMPYKKAIDDKELDRIRIDFANAMNRIAHFYDKILNALSFP